MTGRRLMILIALGAALVIAPSALADDGGGGGRRPPFNQDPGSGGPPGGNPCSISQKGQCLSMTIYEGGYPCTASWCEPQAAAPFSCTSHNMPTCQTGVDAEGEPILLQINNCSFCGV